MKTREIVGIHTEHPLSEIWSNLIFFESEYNSETFLKERIKGDFYGLDYKTLSVLKTKSGVKLDVFRTIEPRDVKDNAIELAYCFKQAREYYNATTNTTELTHPILLYYGMVSLARALVVATYKFRNPKKGHGLVALNNFDYVAVKERGLFPRFHDCYCSAPQIYLSKPKLTLQELFSVIPELRREYEMIYGESSQINPHIDPEKEMDTHFTLTKETQKLTLPTLTSHFLAMFLLSSIARYKPTKWLQLITGQKSGEIFIVKKFLKISERRFPNLIFNELRGKTHLFHSPARWG